MKRLALTACALVLAACSSGASETVSAIGSQAPSAEIISQLPPLSGGYIWAVDYAASTLQFSAVHAGSRFTGEFKTFAAAIKLNPEDLSTAQVHVIVDIGSLDAKDDDRNANLPDPVWFNLPAFPYAVYSARDFSKTVDAYTADGALSIKGISNPAQLTFTLDIEGDTAKAVGKTTLMRPDFKLGTDSSDFANEDWVSFPVDVMFDLTATR